MKKCLPFLAFIFLLAACKPSKDYLSRADEDRTLFDVVNASTNQPPMRMYFDGPAYFVSTGRIATP
jgi:hypothetical protein